MSWSNGALDDDVLGGDLGQREFQGGLARISGKLLNANLVRNGYDLSISNTSVSTPLLYFNVTNKYLGLNTASPAYQLDGASAIQTTNAIATGQLNAANIYASSDTVYSLTGNLYITPNGGSASGTVIAPGVSTSQLVLYGNTITSKSNANVAIVPTGPLAICLSVTISGSSSSGANVKYSRSSGGTTQFTYDANRYIIWSALSPNPVYNTIDPARWLLFDINDSATPLYQNLATDPSTTGWGVYPAGTAAPISAAYTFTSTLGQLTVNSDATISGNLSVTGNISVTGNLQDAHQIIIGDQPMDTVVLGADLNQTLIPNADNTYDIGSSSYRWADLYTPDVNKANHLLPTGITVNNQVYVDGGNLNITTNTVNADLGLNPNSGITYIESLKFYQNSITNTTNNPFIYSDSTGGYATFVATDVASGAVGGMVLPSGPISSRPDSPAVGDTRFNTDGQYLECFNGSIYIVSTGPSPITTAVAMEEYSQIWDLILG